MDRDGLALVQRVGQAPADLHPADQMPFLGDAVEGDAGPRAGWSRGGRGLGGRGLLLPAQEVQWHWEPFVAIMAPRPRRPAGRTRRSILRLEAVLADRLDDGRVGQRRRVAELAALGDVPEQSSHDLAAPG